MKLFESGKIGKLSLKNRIVMAPMSIGGLAEPDGRFSERAIDYYATRAKGGAGLLISGIVRASREFEQPRNPSLLRAPVVDDEVYITRLNELSEAVHDHGSKMAIQLTAGLGRVINPAHMGGGTPIAPSALPTFWDAGTLTRELTTKEIERMVRAFRFGAEVISAAGLDAIEIHGHEGYLFDQFTTALWNKRTDRYGGDLDDRLRFSVEVIRAIKEGAGADFPIIYRIGLTHYLKGGREIEEGLEILRRLETAGVDAFDVDAGCYETWYWPHPPTYQPPGCMVDMAEMAKKAVKVPVMAVGKLGYPEVAERVLQENKADFIILGRALLADPEWPNKVKAGRLEDIRPCIGDHECLKRVIARKYISCSVNPAAGMERQLAITPAEQKKSVLVIGGGPGGMEAARVSAIRGHKVTLWEKGDALGGNLLPASAPDFKQDYRRLVDYLSIQLTKLGVNVELGKEATPELVAQLKPDVVMVATGSSPVVPKIPKTGKRTAIMATDVLLDKHKVGNRVVIIGGGILGCETALYLCQQGKKVTIIEILANVMRDTYKANRMHLLKLITDSGIKILIDSKVSQINDSGVALADKKGKETILAADTVILAAGFKANGDLFEKLKDKVPEVYAIGDCVAPRKVMDAMWEGFRTARLI